MISVYMGGDAEECPECDEMFIDLRTLSDHFDKNHGNSSEDEDKPQKLSSKGKALSRKNNKQKSNKKSRNDFAAAAVSKPEEEECPECDQRFPDLRTLSDHFDKNHGSSSEDEDKPQKLSSKGKTLLRKINKPKNNKKSQADSAAVSSPGSKSSQQKGQKRKRNTEQKYRNTRQANMWKEVRILRRRQKELEEELIRKNKQSEEEMVSKDRQMTEQIENKYEEQITTLVNAKKKEVAMMVDEVSLKQKTLAQKHQELLDSIRNKHKTEEIEMVTQLLAQLDDEEGEQLDEEEEEEEVEREAIPLPPAPDCPICFEPMTPPTRIYQCGAGHLLCGACRPRLLVA